MVKGTMKTRIVAFSFALMLMLSLAMNVCAAEEEVQETDDPYLIVNGTDVVLIGEDYENPETGEYIHWGKERGTDKSFSFKIQSTLKSSKFTVNSTKEKVTCSASITDSSLNPISGYTGHQYTVSLSKGIGSGKSLKFKVGGTQSGTITGLTKGGSYYVQITNNDYLPSTRYLSGSGTIKTVN